MGDLPAGLESPKITLSLIAINLGSFLAATEPDLQVLAGISDPGVEIQRFYDALCDGWGWKPLLSEWDYSATNGRIARELFSDLSRV